MRHGGELALVGEAATPGGNCGHTSHGHSSAFGRRICDTRWPSTDMQVVGGTSAKEERDMLPKLLHLRIHGFPEQIRDCRVSVHRYHVFRSGATPFASTSTGWSWTGRSSQSKRVRAAACQDFVCRVHWSACALRQASIGFGAWQPRAVVARSRLSIAESWRAKATLCGNFKEIYSRHSQHLKENYLNHLRC
jgi:hypothetical protein